MNTFKIAIIGTINLDIIISKKGEQTESLGGILYNVLSLSKVGKDLIEVFPVTYIGFDSKQEFLNLIKQHPNISTNGVVENKKGTNINFLEYSTDNERMETTDFVTDEIDYSMIKPFLSSDVLLFNFISGYDVSLKTIKKVRKNSNSIIFLDVHSLVLKTNKKRRSFCKVKNWQEWIKNINIIQMNIKELQYFTNRTWVKKPDDGEVKETIQMLLNKRLNIVLITSGEKGVYLGYRNKVYFFEQKYRSVVKDTTGCGDIFSSSFLAKYLISNDPFISCKYANLVAGMSTKEAGIKKCANLGVRSQHLTLKIQR